MQPWLAESKTIEYFACCTKGSLFKGYIVRNRDNQKIGFTTYLRQLLYISHVYVRDLMSKINLALNADDRNLNK